MNNAILINPASGKSSLERKIELLEPIAKKLKATLHHNTNSRLELMEQAKKLAKYHEILIVAGGDGTFADVLNSVPKGTNLAYLPTGSGNALLTAIGLVGPKTSFLKGVLGIDTLNQATEAIYKGKPRPIDVIECNGRLSLLASLGFDAHVLKHREPYLEAGQKGFLTYAKSVIKTILSNPDTPIAKVQINGETTQDKIYALIISKHPYYGYGVTANPRAELGDGKIHVRTFSNLTSLASHYAKAFFNLSSKQTTAKHIRIKLEQSIPYQLDGDLIGEEKQLEFKIKEKYINITS
ncbi:MAG: diacylglycerol kinase family protein [Nanoarchaeota archaeon]|nr:diacylglycerol kinase family protein [Nanoarchaeota archaeon]